MTEPKVTLAHKKNLRDAEALKPALLARIKAASGVDYTFDIEPKFEDFVVTLIKSKSNSHEYVGDALYKENGYLDHTAKLFEKACQDSMIKEAIVEATPNKKIVLNLHDGEEDSTKLIQFKDGNMVLMVTPQYFNTWIKQYSAFDLTQVL